MEFLGVGAAEALVVFVLILILVGPQRFPELMRQGGRYYRIARGYTSEVMKDVRAAVDELEQEVKNDADLQSVRELSEVGTELERDLSDARRDADAAGAETAAAAQSVAANERSPRPISSAPSAGASNSARPSTRSTGGTGSAARPASTPARGSKPARAETGHADSASSRVRATTTPSAADTPAAAPTERVELPEDDPFRALEARRAAARRGPAADPPDDAEQAES